MRIATDPGQIGFEERIGEQPAAQGCDCRFCRARGRTPGQGAPQASPPRPRRALPAARGGRIPQLTGVRGACLATTVLAGAGVIGLGLGAGTAEAMPAPSHAGWDGSRYWFKNDAGEWRYTAHYDVYVSRTGQSGAKQPTGNGTGTTSSSDGSGLRQGWDGSRYWFRNEAGEWRYTVHYDVYLARTQQVAGGAKQQPPSQVPAPAGVESAISYALAQLGKPYVWGGNGPNGYDCSGLVQQAFRRAGINLPRVADDQYAATTPISPGRLRRGDLIFWSSNGRASGIHHVAIYLGNNQYVEAPRPGKQVRISTLNSGYYPTHMGRP